MSRNAYIWTAPGKPISVHLEWHVIERMLQDIMRGFGSVPRRGAEVGGLLLGRVAPGRPTTVQVTGFENVRCEHGEGPSFILSARDRENWSEVFERTQFAPGRDTYAVGYYRSHTRDGLSLAPEDLAIMEEFFPAPHGIALLVKPFASRTSQAGFFFYEHGSIRADATYLEFPFRPRETSKMPLPEFSAQRHERPLFTPAQREAAFSPPDLGTSQVTGVPDAVSPIEEGARQAPASESSAPFPAFSAHHPVGQSKGNGWNWAVPLAVLILVVCGFLGYRYASGVQDGWFRRSDPYALGLSFTTASDNLHLKWNREAPVIRSASRGVLTITDGGTIRRVDLGRGQLQNGSVVYRRMSNEVVLKLEVFANDRSSVAEILELQLTPEPLPDQRLQDVPASPNPEPQAPATER